METATEPPDDLLIETDPNNVSPWTKSDTITDMNLLSPPINLYRNNMSTMNGGQLDRNALNSVLIGDTFLIDHMSPSFFVNPLTDSVSNSVGSSIDDDIMNMIKTNMDVQKPFESFDEQIIMTPAAPPPLKDDFNDDGLLHLNENLVVGTDLGMDFETQKQIGFSPGLSDDSELFECNLFGNNVQSDELMLDAWTD